MYPKAYFNPRTAGTIAFCAVFLGALFAGLSFGIAIGLGILAAAVVLGWLKLTARL